MAFTIDGTNGLTFNNATTQASAGCVLQVVYASTTTRTIGTSTTYVDVTGLTATITPKFSTSKILVLINCSYGTGSSTGAESSLAINLVRGSTQVYALTQAWDLRAATASGESNMYFNGGFTYQDSPATTSSTTYKCQVKQNSSGGRTYDISASSSPSSITLLEIAG